MVEITLSQGEAMMIWRRRQGLNIKEMAKKYGFGRNRYSSYEKMETIQELETPDVFPLADYEKCLILRKRKKWTQQECADMMGITRYWYNQMENGNEPCQCLVEFWKS